MASERSLDSPRSVSRLIRVLIVACLAVVAADLFYDKHGYFAYESWFGFQALFGFASFCFLVLAGKQLRKVLMRDETYYDRD